MNRVLVVDDHDLIRQGICQLVGEIPGIEVIGEAGSGEDAIVKTAELSPDIVFMDLRMPGIGGAEATRRILASQPGLKVIIVTAVNDEIHPTKMLKAGACGYITKKADSSEIAKAIKEVTAGRIYVSPMLAQQMVVQGIQASQPESPFAELSQRELQIAQMITNGHRTAEISETLNISPKTISTYRYRIYQKLGVSNDVELTLAAVKFNIVDPEDVL